MSDTHESPGSQHTDYGPQEPVTDYATALRGPEVATGVHTRFSSSDSLTTEPTADANMQVMVFSLAKLAEKHPEYQQLIGATTNVVIQNSMRRLLTVKPDLYDLDTNVDEQRRHEEEIQEAQKFYDVMVVFFERRKVQDTEEQKMVFSSKAERKKLEFMRVMLKACIEGVQLVDFEATLGDEEKEIYEELKPQRFRKAIVSGQIRRETPEETPARKSEETPNRETQRKLFTEELRTVTEAQITFTTQAEGEEQIKQLKLQIKKLKEKPKKDKDLKKPQTPGSSPSGSKSTTPSSSRGSSPPRTHVSPSEVGTKKTIGQIFDQMRSNE
jgi:hypothetical protein